MSEISAKLIQLKLANLINGTYSQVLEDSPWDSFGQVCRQIRESLRADSPVRTFPQQAKAQESAPNDQDSGRKCYDSLASYDPISCSWKTCQHSLFGGLEPFSGKWPRSGMTVNGTAYRLPTLALLTGGTESGLLESGIWPTPQARDWKGPQGRAYKGTSFDLPAAIKMWPTPVAYDATPGGPNNHYKGLGHIAKHNPKKMWPTPRSSKAMGENLDTVKTRVDKRGFLGAKLEEKVAIWPTPTTAASGRTPEEHNRIEKEKKAQNPNLGGLHKSLYTAVLEQQRQMWPTPTVQDGGKATKKWRENHQNNLTAAIFSPEKLLPTPTARDWKGGFRTESLKRKDGKSRSNDALPNAVLGGKGVEPVPGQLTPQFVSWLMGYPLDWCDITDEQQR